MTSARGMFFRVSVVSRRRRLSDFRSIVELDFKVQLLVPFLFVVNEIGLLVAPCEIVSELLAVFLAEWTTHIGVICTLIFHAVL